MPIYSPDSLCDTSSFRHISQLMVRGASHSGMTEMTLFESSFLSGLVKRSNPRKIVEVGVAAGGTSAVILATMKDMRPDAHLYSVDTCTSYYRDTSRETGYLVEEIFACRPENWTTFFGQSLPACLDDIGGDIDCLILDTTHCLPGELLDFIVALPYLTENALLILHDIHMFFGTFRPDYATKILFDTISGNKILCKDPEKKNRLPNIGAIFLTRETRRNADDLFYALSMPWTYVPDQGLMDQYITRMGKHYSEDRMQYFFQAALENAELLTTIRSRNR